MVGRHGVFATTVVITMSLLVFNGCATTQSSASKPVAENAATAKKSPKKVKPKRKMASKGAQGPDRIASPKAAPGQPVAAPLGVPAIPKKAFLSNSETGRSGAFKNLITVFQSAAKGPKRVLTIVYDGKSKGPVPNTTRRTSHVRIDASKACPGSKAMRPVKLRQLWNVYHSPGRAEFNLNVNSKSSCDKDQIVRIETLGLRCQNINLATCLRMEVHEVLEIPFGEFNRLETMRAGEYPGQATPDDKKVLEAAVR